MAPDDRAYHIRHELKPGDLGMVVHLHGLLYAREYGLDTTFEPYVAEPLAQCVRAGSGRIWIAEDETGRMLGSIAMVDVGQHVARNGLSLRPRSRRLAHFPMELCRAWRRAQALRARRVPRQ